MMGWTICSLVISLMMIEQRGGKIVAASRTDAELVTIGAAWAM
jgi:hypothetical protein